MEKLIIKKVDSYSSQVFNDKIVNEYIIYNALGDDTKISAITVMGDEQKNIVIANEIMKNLMFGGGELTIEEF